MKIRMFGMEFAGSRRGTPGRARGFTFIELIIVLAVMAVLLGLAVPEFSSILHRNRISSAASDLYAALNTARSEAVKRRSTVSVCPSADGVSCVGSDIDWSQGWMVFVDGDGNGQRANGEAILKLAAPHERVEMQAQNTVESFVRFNPTGDAFGTVGEFRICHGDTNANSVAVRVSAVGRIELANRNQADCNAS